MGAFLGSLLLTLMVSLGARMLSHFAEEETKAPSRKSPGPRRRFESQWPAVLFVLRSSLAHLGVGRNDISQAASRPGFQLGSAHRRRGRSLGGGKQGGVTLCVSGGMVCSSRGFSVAPTPYLPQCGKVLPLEKFHCHSYSQRWASSWALLTLSPLLSL